jgi:hypothetical protein
MIFLPEKFSSKRWSQCRPEDGLIAEPSTSKNAFMRVASLLESDEPDHLRPGEFSCSNFLHSLNGKIFYLSFFYVFYFDNRTSFFVVNRRQFLPAAQR